MIVRAQHKIRARSTINFQSLLFTTTFVLLALLTFPDSEESNAENSTPTGSIATVEHDANKDMLEF